MSDKLRTAELRKSRKYYVSSVHEIASGRLEILDRYIGEDKQVWLKYTMIDTNEVSENREVNINSSIYKFLRKQMAQAFEEDNRELFDQNASYKLVLEELHKQQLEVQQQAEEQQKQEQVHSEQSEHPEHPAQQKQDYEDKTPNGKTTKEQRDKIDAYYEQLAKEGNIWK